MSFYSFSKVGEFEEYSGGHGVQELDYDKRNHSFNFETYLLLIKRGKEFCFIGRGSFNRYDLSKKKYPSMLIGYGVCKRKKDTLFLYDKKINNCYKFHIKKQSLCKNKLNIKTNYTLITNKLYFRNGLIELGNNVCQDIVDLSKESFFYKEEYKRFEEIKKLKTISNIKYSIKEIKIGQYKSNKVYLTLSKNKTYLLQYNNEDYAVINISSGFWEFKNNKLILHDNQFFDTSFYIDFVDENTISYNNLPMCYENLIFKK